MHYNADNVKHRGLGQLPDIEEFAQHEPVPEGRGCQLAFAPVRDMTADACTINPIHTMSR